MKIIPGKYKEERNWKEYITLNSPDDRFVSLVFLWRLAAFCKDFRVKSTMTIGSRSTAKQKVLYDMYLAGKGNLAAKPGTSWHETGLAVDVREAAEFGWFMRFSKRWIMPYSSLKQGLAEYGIIAPLNNADKPASSVEWWHWQPIETAGFAGDRMKFLDPDDAINGKPAVVGMNDSGVWVMELQRIMNRSQTGKYDGTLQVAVKAFQKSNGLTADGIVGPATWAKLND
jgi:hypothetical protein